MPNFFEGTPQPEREMEFSNVPEDIKSLGEIVAKLEKSEQPIPEEVRTAFSELQAAKGVKDQLGALRKMQTALEGYDPVKEEIDAHDARAYVAQMILQIEKGEE
ncbi:hypothetical protein ACFL0L_04745 [Patescibacteria group bacterium]